MTGNWFHCTSLVGVCPNVLQCTNNMALTRRTSPQIMTPTSLLMWDVKWTKSGREDGGPVRTNNCGLEKNCSIHVKFSSMFLAKNGTNLRGRSRMWWGGGGMQIFCHTHNCWTTTPDHLIRFVNKWKWGMNDRSINPLNKVGELHRRNSGRLDNLSIIIGRPLL